MLTVARVLAVVAVVSVVGVSAVALVVRPGDPDRWLVGGESRVRLGSGWELTGPGTVVQYPTRAGTLRVSAPAVYAAGHCRGTGSRAFAGFLPVATGSTHRVARAVAARWARAAAGATGRPGAVTTRALDSGHRADATVRAPAGECPAPRARVSVLALDLPGERVRPLVLVRDLDAPGALGDADAERLLASAESG